MGTASLSPFVHFLDCHSVALPERKSPYAGPEQQNLRELRVRCVKTGTFLLEVVSFKGGETEPRGAYINGNGPFRIQERISDFREPAQSFSSGRERNLANVPR